MEKLRHNQRRRVPRVNVDFPVTVIAGRKQHRSQAVQLSEFGILVSGVYGDLVGQRVDLELKLEPPAEKVSAAGIVAYTTDTGTGIRFENEDPAQAAVLKSYVQARGIGVVRP